MDQHYAYANESTVLSCPHLDIPPALMTAITEAASEVPPLQTPTVAPVPDKSPYEQVITFQAPEAALFSAPTALATESADLTPARTPHKPVHPSLFTHWPASKWLNRPIPVRDILACLGLALTEDSRQRTMSRPKFASEIVQAFSKEISKLAETLPQGREELAAAAADSTYLERDLQRLLEEEGYGAMIWSAGLPGSKRECLVEREEDWGGGVLSWEREGDRDMIKLHLHQWIFMKACNTLHNKAHLKPRMRADHKMDRGMSAPTEGVKNRNRTVKRARSYGKASASEPTVKRQTVSKPLADMSNLPLPLRPGVPRSERDTEPANTNTVTVTSTNTSTTHPSLSTTSSSTSSSSSSSTLRRFHLADALLTLLHPPTNFKPTTHEPTILNDLEKEWALDTTLYKSELGASYPACNTILHAWLSERRLIHTLEFTLSTCVKPAERFRSLNELRRMRFTREAFRTKIGGKVVGAREVLCLVLAKVTMGQGEVVMEMWREGLQGLEGELGNLGHGDVEIVMDGTE